MVLRHESFPAWKGVATSTNSCIYDKYHITLGPIKRRKNIQKATKIAAKHSPNVEGFKRT